MRREYRERFPRHRGLAIPTCVSIYMLSLFISKTTDNNGYFSKGCLGQISVQV